MSTSLLCLLALRVVENLLHCVGAGLASFWRAYIDGKLLMMSHQKTGDIAMVFKAMRCNSNMTGIYNMYTTLLKKVDPLQLTREGPCSCRNIRHHGISWSCQHFLVVMPARRTGRAIVRDSKFFSDGRAAESWCKAEKSGCVQIG